MSSPFVAGCAALVIDALKQRGTNWSFSSSQHARLVKMLLCATSSESNTNRESTTNNPTLQRATAGPHRYPIGKDRFEGYGMVNPDAAVEAATLSYTPGVVAVDTLGSNANDKRVWARSVQLASGVNFSVNLTTPSTGDFDVHLYSCTPSAYGTPILLASGTLAGSGVAESFNFTPSIATNALLIVKRISGSGTFSLVGTGPVAANSSASPTNGSAPLVATFTNLSSGATNYAWNFGNLNTNSAVNPTNTYSTPGNYSVTLVAFGTGGSNTLLRTAYIAVTSAPPPLTIANFSAEPTNGLAPLAVTFTNLSSNAINFVWDFGDGNVSTNQHPLHTFTSAGNYSVTLFANGLAGTNSITFTNYITATNLPPLLVVTPASLHLGTMLTEAWSQATFTISNAGGLLLNANANISSDPFFLLDGDTNPVPSIAFNLPALGSTNLTARFLPTSEGGFSNVVVFISDGGLSTNVVTGYGFGTPVIVQLTSSATEFTFAFATVPGKNYEVQYKDALDNLLWQTLQVVDGDGSLKTITNLTTAPAERYYRLSVP